MRITIKSISKGDVTYPYRNIQITNKNRGNGSLTADNDQYENVLIGFGMPTNPGNRCTLIGGQAGASTTGDSNTSMGAYSLYANTSGIYNTVIGDRAGRYITVVIKM